MIKKTLFAALLISSNAAVLHAGLVDALNEISNEIDASGGNASPPAESSAQAPVQSSATNGLSPLSTNTDPSGKSTSTYKNPDGSYTVIEKDAKGNVLSEKKFGDASEGALPPVAEPGESTIIDIGHDGSIKQQILASGTATDTVTGETTKVESNQDGTRTVTQSDKDGKVLSTETRGKEASGGSSYDPVTGQKITSEIRDDGSHLVTTTDKDGKVVSQEVTGKGQPVGGSAYDPDTGITTTSYRQPDGSRLVTKTDSTGAVISRETKR